MEPVRNPALQSVKLQANAPSSIQGPGSLMDMPAPPAYHMVVDPRASVPRIQDTYTHEEEQEERDDDDDIPEITINAATQIRGTGNIVSIAQIDSARIANLIAVLLKGDDISTTPSSPQPQADQSPLATLANLATTASRREIKKLLRIQITVNCGATIIGDRNIVGPGLGDIARQMQLAQRNHVLQAQQQQRQQQQQQQQQQVPGCQKTPSPTQRRGTPYQTQAAIAQLHGVSYPAPALTPPMSRSASLQGDSNAGLKRKFEGDVAEGIAKKYC